MFLNHRDEIVLGITRQCGLAEMRVVGQEVRRLTVKIGEITAAATGHQDLLADPVGALEYDNVTAAPGGSDSAHQSGSAAANY